MILREREVSDVLARCDQFQRSDGLSLFYRGRNERCLYDS